jgi:hypothetical protein
LHHRNTKDANDQSPPNFQDTAILPIVGTGLSVLREALASADEIVRLAHELVSTAARNLPTSERVSVIGVLRFAASVARNRQFAAGSEYANKPKYCVYETPKAAYPSHADVLITATRFASKSKQKNDAFELFADLKNWFVGVLDYEKANLVGIAKVGEKAAPI